MFSQLGPVFKTMFRQAEAADTRLGIKKDEKHDEGHKDSAEEHASETRDLWEDSAGVTVEALLVFLKDYLKNNGVSSFSNKSRPQVQEENAAVIDSAIFTAQSSSAIPPVTAQAARAVQAYSRQSTEAAAPLPPPASDHVTMTEALTAEDVRTVYVLIEDLEMLQTRGIQAVSIERADTFLGSLIKAVSIAKQAL